MLFGKGMVRNMKNAGYIFLCGMLACSMCGCGKAVKPTQDVEVIQMTSQETEPIIIRDEPPAAEEAVSIETESATVEEEEEIVSWVDRMAGEQPVSYTIETNSYENGCVKVSYPQFSQMQDMQMQDKLNEQIKQIVLLGSTATGLSAFEYSYEIASAGKGVVSFVFRGYVNYEGSAYPVNTVKTLNINLLTGENIRLTDYVDVAAVVSALETDMGYEVVTEGVTKEDFSAYLNNGYVTDYAITMLDYDMDLQNLEFSPIGFSCIRDNHLVLFVEAEHTMGDYVEIIFDEEL